MQEHPNIRAAFISSDPNIQAFVEYFCNSRNDFNSADFSSRMLYDCLAHEKPEIMKIYMWIYQTATLVMEGACHPEIVADLKTLMKFSVGIKLINRTFMCLLEHEISLYWDSAKNKKIEEPGLTLIAALRRYVRCGERPKRNMVFHAYLIYHDWPTPMQLRSIVEGMDGLEVTQDVKVQIILLTLETYTKVPVETIEEIIDLKLVD